MSSRWKERNVKTRKDFKSVRENLCQTEEDALAWHRQATWYGPVAVDEGRFVAVARNSAGKKEEQKEK